MFALPTSEHELSPAYRPLINIGAGLDVPTGWFVRGHRGQWVLMGGMGALVGMTGDGNTFKSTLCDYMMLSAGARLYSTTKVFRCGTYDTEVNIHADRKREFASRFVEFEEIWQDIVGRGRWEITDEAIALGDDFWETEKKYLKAKKALGEKVWVDTPFLDFNKERMRMMFVTFGQIDSLTKLTSKSQGEITDEKELSERQVIEMRGGLAKKQLMGELPRTCAAYNHYCTVTAHKGDSIQIQQGPMALPPKKQLQHMKGSTKVKGVSDYFFYLTTAFWDARVAKPFNNKDRNPVYPRGPEETNLIDDVDTCAVELYNLRGKSGMSGIPNMVLVSQMEGVLPELTEFYILNRTKLGDPKKDPGFGLNGSVQNYELDLLPGVKLSRTTVRSKLAENGRLCRALNISSEICQMYSYYRTKRLDFLQPAEIRKRLSDRGYSVEELLDTTRGWWTVNDDIHPLKFLSSRDFIEMAKDKYIPYWMKNPPKQAIEAYNQVNPVPWKYTEA